MKRPTILVMLMCLLAINVFLSSCKKEPTEQDPTTSVSEKEAKKQPSLDDLFEEDKEEEASRIASTDEKDQSNKETLDDLFGKDETTAEQDQTAVRTPPEQDQKPPVVDREKLEERKEEVADRQIKNMSPSAYSDDEVKRPLSIRDQEEPHFLVLAGTFLNLMNAEREAARLQAFGFDNAEVRQFDLSEYHIVIAGRYETLPPARQMAKDLVNKAGVLEVYVHRQRSKYFGNSPFDEEPVFKATRP